MKNYMVGTLEEWRKALEGKGLNIRISRNETAEYNIEFDFDFEESEHGSIRESNEDEC